MTALPGIVSSPSWRVVSPLSRSFQSITSELPTTRDFPPTAPRTQVTAGRVKLEDVSQTDARRLPVFPMSELRQRGFCVGSVRHVGMGTEQRSTPLGGARLSAFGSQQLCHDSR